MFISWQIFCGNGGESSPAIERWTVTLCCPLDPRLFAPRFRQSVGTLVTHGKAGVCARISITVLLSTKTYHEKALPLRDDDYEGDPLGERSHVLPWSLATLTSPADVDHYLTSLVDDRIDDVASQLIDYIAV